MFNANEAKNQLKNSSVINLFKEMYIEETVINCQEGRYSKLIDEYEEYFKDRETITFGMFSAPGRTEIGGNHTDHQNGRILAASVNMDSIAIAGTNNSKSIIVKSEGYDEFTVNLEDLEINEQEYETSAALVKGICFRFLELGYKVDGFNCYITSDVLEGSGISSSASFEILICNVIKGLFENDISAVEMAKISQYSENNYFNKPCGLMDQLASSVGGLVYVDFKDKDNPITKQVEFDFDTSEYVMCLIDTKGSHHDLTKDYADITTEMREIANYFGADVLRAVDESRFYSEISELRTKCSDRAIIRAHHFFSENNRVVNQVDSLQAGDFEEFLKQVTLSGNSSFKYLQNIYSLSDYNNQEISLAIALSEEFNEGDGAVRIHGGGFAGTIQVYVKKKRVLDYVDFIENIFGEGSCHRLSIRPVGGVQVF